MRTSNVVSRIGPAVLGVALGLPLCLSPAGAANNVDIGDETITITVLVELLDGTQELADRWGPAMTQVWNAGPGGEPFRYCGKELLITTDIKVLAPGEEPSRGDYHLVWARPAGPDRRFIPRVRSGGPAYSARPDQYNYSGEWEHFADPSGDDLAWEATVVPHEFGHMLGLGDEFTWQDTNNNGRRDVGEPTLPDLGRYPDANQSVMGAKDGRALRRHIREIARKHDLERHCRLHVDYELVGSIRSEVDQTEQTTKLSMELEQEVAGILLGSGSGESAFSRLLNNPQGGSCGSSGRTDHAFDVDGLRSGDSFTIELPDLATPLVHPGGACVFHPDGSPRHSIPAVDRKVIEGTLTDGLFEETRHVYIALVRIRVEERFEQRD